MNQGQKPFKGSTRAPERQPRKDSPPESRHRTHGEDLRDEEKRFGTTF